MSCPMEQDVMGPVLHNSAREEVGSENVYPQMASNGNVHRGNDEA